jgi:hypothetical protein
MANRVTTDAAMKQERSRQFGQMTQQRWPRKVGSAYQLLRYSSLVPPDRGP